MAGIWMARTGVKGMVIDQKPCRTQSGHADGIESRTLEILDSFGIGEKIWNEANRTIDLCLWVLYQQRYSYTRWESNKLFIES
jgi:phenol 2-monooxygenase